ncbi:MAG: ABC transporter permease [Bacteroidota bacterium]
MIKSHLLLFWRNLYRRPFHSFLNLSCLTIGIAASLLILLYLDFELGYDRFHNNSANVYRITTAQIKTQSRTIESNIQGTPINLGPLILQDVPEVAAVARTYGFLSNLEMTYQNNTLTEEPVVAADPAVFKLFDYHLLDGDTSEALSGPNKIVLSESLARRMFGDRPAVGKIIDASFVHQRTAADEQRPLLVSGVFRDLPANTVLQASALVSVETDSESANYYFDRFSCYTYLMAFPNADLAALTEKLTGLYDKYLDPEIEPVLVNATHELLPLPAIHLETSGGYDYIYIFAAIAVLLLLIALISYVNLATAQASRRSMEVGVRKVMGSDRRQLIWQFLSESLAYTALSVGLAFLLVRYAVPFLNGLFDMQLSIQQLMQPQAYAFLLGMALLIGLLGGSYPAFFLSSFQPVSVMKGPASKATPVRRMLLGVQFAVVIFVLFCTGMIYQQLQFMRTQDLGFDQEQMVEMRLAGQAQTQKLPVLRETFQQSPLVVSVGASSFTPGMNGMFRGPLSGEGTAGTDPRFVRIGRVDYDFFSSMDVELKAGRNFSPDFPGDSLGSVLVNERLIEEFGLPDDPIGQKLRRGDKGNPNFLTVIGVVEDFNQNSLYTPIESQMFLLQPNPNRVVAKLRDDIPAALEHLRSSWASVYPNTEFTFHFLDEMLQEQYVLDQRRGSIFLSFSLVTLAIAFFGLFGLASYISMQRVREIGIRRILGASVSDMVLLLTRSFLFLVLLSSIPAFLAGWWVVRRWLEGFAFRTEISIFLFVLVLFFTLLLTFLTTGFHALRSTRLNPADTLKHD